MKKIILFLLFVAFNVYSQNITNTLGSGGLFFIKDASNNYLTLDQSTGQVNILKTLRLENTTSPSLGVIYMGEGYFLHNYGTESTFLGINSGNFYMTGIGFNTAVGGFSLNANATGYYNSAVGNYSLRSNNTGYRNLAFGYASLYSNTSGRQNTALGDQSLFSNTTGIANTANGVQALYSNTIGTNNTANGISSLYSNTEGIRNTANGDYTLYSNTTGLFNTANGSSALYSNTTGNQNTAIGNVALTYNTTGSNNTALGSSSGSNISSGSNLTCIGYNAQPTAPDAINQITLGDNQVTSLRCNVTTITSLSDSRDKKNIRDLNLGIDFLMKLKPRQFNWDKREWYDDNKSDDSKMKEEPTAGFIAQELDEVQILENVEWLNLVLKDNPEKWEATPGNLFPVVVKAIQELNEKNEQLKIQNEKLSEGLHSEKIKNHNLEERLVKFEEMQTILVKELEQIKSNQQIFKVQIVNSENNNQ